MKSANATRSGLKLPSALTFAISTIHPRATPQGGAEPMANENANLSFLIVRSLSEIALPWGMSVLPLVILTSAMLGALSNKPIVAKTLEINDE